MQRLRQIPLCLRGSHALVLSDWLADARICSELVWGWQVVLRRRPSISGVRGKTWTYMHSAAIIRGMLGLLGVQFIMLKRR